MMKRAGVVSKDPLELVMLPERTTVRKFVPGVLASTVTVPAKNELVPSVRVRNGELVNWRLVEFTCVLAGTAAKSPVPLSTVATGDNPFVMKVNEVAEFTPPVLAVVESSLNPRVPVTKAASARVLAPARARTNKQQRVRRGKFMASAP